GGGGAGAGPRPASEPRRQPRGPTAALSARRTEWHGELVALPGPGGVATQRSPAVGTAFRAAVPGLAPGGGAGGRSAAGTATVGTKPDTSEDHEPWTRS